MNIYLQKSIAQKVRELRLERRWTQAGLARILHLSQSRLSEIEGGQGSFTAEQLIVILTNFNVTLDYFVSTKSDPDRQLQNSLARLGARHLHEDTQLLASEKLKDLINVLREAVVSAKSPRLITGLAPVLVSHSDAAVLSKLRFELDDIGFSNRYGWILESIHDALESELGLGKVPPGLVTKFQKCANILQQIYVPISSCFRSQGRRTHEVWGVDEDIISRETLEDVRRRSSRIAKKWSIVTRIQKEDFVEALRNGFDY